MNEQVLIFFDTIVAWSPRIVGGILVAIVGFWIAGIITRQIG